LKTQVGGEERMWKRATQKVRSEVFVVLWERNRFGLKVASVTRPKGGGTMQTYVLQLLLVLLHQNRVNLYLSWGQRRCSDKLQSWVTSIER